MRRMAVAFGSPPAAAGLDRRGLHRAAHARAMQHASQAHLPNQGAVHGLLVGRGGSSGQPGRGRRRPAVQRDRHAVPGQRRDHRRLIAQPEQPIGRRPSGAIPVWNPGDGQRTRQQRTRPLQKRGEAPATGLDRADQARPGSANSLEWRTPDGDAEHAPAILDMLHPGISAGKQCQLDRAFQTFRGLGRQGKIHLHADRIARGVRTRQVPQIVLASRLKHRHRRPFGLVREADRPARPVPGQPPDGLPGPDLCTLPLGLTQQSGIEHAA